jgi:UDP-N-acetylglucosamine diphosphorylase/glucosamine-1-phosphate N-acetyltransferase
MHYILFDDATRLQLLPFTHTRPIADIRCGIMTMRERWALLLSSSTISTLTEPYLQAVFPIDRTKLDSIVINGGIFATKELVDAIIHLPINTQLLWKGILIAAHLSDSTTLSFDNLSATTSNLLPLEFSGTINKLEHIWDIFSQNERAITDDFNLLTLGRVSQNLPDHVMAMGSENIFIEEGAVINPCIINATKGPVYIATESEIMEGCMLRGPLAIGAHSVVKMGAKIYGATTIGEGCKVGGEISNVVFFANSNKGHDGFIGNAVIGEWCNLGADTNCSNLKNNYDTIKIWDEYTNKLVSTHLQFCGLMMGDHSKCGINTMFNTGTVVGVSCNIFGSDFPDKFVPSFSWGGNESKTTYSFEKAIETANRMMIRRHKKLSKEEEAMYHYLFEHTKSQRGN